MPTIMVTDSYDRPVEGALVFVKWVGGTTSNGKTDSLGMANLNCSGGTIEYVNINGKQKLGKVRVSDDQIVQLHV